MSDNLFAFLRGRFPADLDRVFIDQPGGPTLRYADILDQSGRLANLFRARGIAPGDRIAVQTDKSADALIAYLATLRAGAVYLPLNPDYTAGELRYFLGDAEPGMFVCRPADEAAMRDLAGAIGVPRVETLGADGGGGLIAAARDQSTEFDDVSRAADDLAAILYTSGTTGRSKGAMLTHANLASNAETLRECWRFTAEDRLLHALPIFHTHGLFVATNTMLAAGGSMIFLPRFDVREIIRLLPRATVLMGVPTFYTRLLGEADFTRELVAHMRLFISGSAPLSAETHRAFAARAGHAILERYGMTETGMNTSNPYNGERVPGTVGPPLPGIEIRIADPETGRPTPGEIGVIEIRGPNVFKGYWRMPEKTAEEFRDDGFFISGDLGHIDPRGYVHIVGRAKDLIISGGFNVYPAEVEAAIEALPGIKECAVVGAPHPDFGEAVVAVIAPAPGAELTEDGVISALAGQIARYKLPRRALFVDDLPRNAMGKTQKKDLRERYAGIFASGSPG